MEQVRVAGEPVSIREWQLSLEALRAKRIRERTGDRWSSRGGPCFQSRQQAHRSVRNQSPLTVL